MQTRICVQCIPGDTSFSEAIEKSALGTRREDETFGFMNSGVKDSDLYDEFLHNVNCPLLHSIPPGPSPCSHL